MNTISDHLETIGRLSGSLARAMDAAKECLSSDEALRNHPERRQWEGQITAMVPPLPSIINKLSALERQIKRASA
jgi:hypothetical protein